MLTVNVNRALSANEIYKWNRMCEVWLHIHGQLISCLSETKNGLIDI